MRRLAARRVWVVPKSVVSSKQEARKLGSGYFITSCVRFAVNFQDGGQR